MFTTFTMDNSNKENTLKDLRSEFFNHILNWNPDWFRDKKCKNTIPNVIKNIKMTAGQLHYNNVEEYQNVMFPQLIHEYWFTLQKDYEAFFKEESCKQIAVKMSDKLPLLKIEQQEDNENSCLYVIHFTRSSCCVKNEQDCIHPRKGDLVELGTKENKYFAYVVKKNVSKIKRGYREICYKLTLSTSSRTSLNLQKCLSIITSITFLEGCLGMVEALSCLETFPLCKLILSPNAEQYRMPSQLKLNVSDITTGAHPNPSQLKVISGIVGAIELSEPRICLVQGPPGTGKSNTIVNLIASMIKRDNDIQFLVCAPSNKAVDSLALQLMKIQPILEYQNIPFKVVRVGNEEKIDGVVRNISLDMLADGRREKENVLKNSQVITSTLTSCYTNNCMRQVFGDDKFYGRLVCIIDEAAQANELLTLIPLLLGVKLLFLVGDHKQLEPIVLSQEAKRYGYNSSLFSRAQKIFKNEKINPIAMLNTQYRMVEPISCWPNKYFYNGRLKDAAIVNPLGICNYMLFNHNFPQNPNGRANKKEAELVVKLIAFLRKKLNLKENGKITIGVITPYHDQRELIKNLLDSDENKFPRELQQSNKKPLYHELMNHLSDSKVNQSPKLVEKSKKQIQISDAKLDLKYINNCEKENERTNTTIINQNICDQKLTETNGTLTRRSKTFGFIINLFFFIFSILFLHCFGENYSPNKRTKSEKKNKKFGKKLILEPENNYNNKANTLVINREPDHKKTNGTIATSAKLFQNLQLDYGSNDDGDNSLLNVGFEVEKNKTIEVNTVDSFQGSERDIIIMSCVRSHELGFTKNPNRLNVSITRAKHTLIMFGNFEAFTGNRMWSSMIRDATKRNVLVEVNDSNAESVFNQYVSSELLKKNIVSKTTKKKIIT